MKSTLCRHVIKITMLNLIIALIILAVLSMLGLLWAYQRGVVDSKKFNCITVNHDTVCEEIKSE